MNATPRMLAGELVGTFILVLLGCGAVHAAVLTGAQSGLWQVAIVWGLGVMFAAYVCGGVSGAHINPAMTIAMAFWGRFEWDKVAGYIAAQVAGAFLAAAFLFGMYFGPLEAKEKARGVTRGTTGSIITAMCYGEFYPNPGEFASRDQPWSDSDWEAAKLRVPTSRAILTEVLCTAILALVVFGVTDSRNPSAPPEYLAPLFIGLTVAGLISIAGPLTQACFNPARDFGPRLFTFLAGWGTAAMPGPNGSGFVTVYILAPIVGAVAGGGVYELLLRPAFLTKKK
ncbi:MAG: aquaporin family protein [Planctomycetaceae bacterium]|nr:aquaporin family protein [Planctomycetaceae bacterium]